MASAPLHPASEIYSVQDRAHPFPRAAGCRNAASNSVARCSLSAGVFEPHHGPMTTMVTFFLVPLYATCITTLHMQKVCAPAELLTHLGHVFDVLVSRPITPSHCVLAEPYEHNGRVPCSADVPKLFHVVPCDFCYGSLLLEEHIVKPAEAFTTGNHHLGHNLGPLHT